MFREESCWVLPRQGEVEDIPHQQSDGMRFGDRRWIELAGGCRRKRQRGVYFLECLWIFGRASKLMPTLTPRSRRPKARGQPRNPTINTTAGVCPENGAPRHRQDICRDISRQGAASATGGSGRALAAALEAGMQLRGLSTGVAFVRRKA